ncbi:eukaryotic translation initiation factor 3 subunit J [Oryzias latipes]|uniref:Eukaryotic translation initiation factor 3 subunit J n=1 Tax=Oryzias latipes TaxID=8090 RepID=H2LP66_ORYLA|nr:eukaryotic translation initiation factor 3 subunit J [Oryzias latipes]
MPSGSSLHVSPSLSNTANMADWDAETFEPEEPLKKAAVVVAVMDKWEGEDEEEDVKDNWDDDEEEDDEKKKEEAKKPETKVSDKKRLSEKIKEKENRLKKKQQELQEQEQEELTPEEQLAEKLRVKKLQEEADLELAKDAFGVGSVTGIDAMCPSSKEEFTEFEKVLKEKISQFEKSVHYSSFLESLFRELCISLEVEDLKKVSNSLSVLLSEKQKQEKQNKGKKKKKGVIAGGGLKAQLRDDLDYAEFDGGYAQDYEDFM